MLYKYVKKQKARLKSSRKKNHGKMTSMLRKRTINRASTNNKMRIKRMCKKKRIP